MQTAELRSTDLEQQPESSGNRFISDKPIRNLDELQPPIRDTTKNRCTGRPLLCLLVQYYNTIQYTRHIPSP